MVRAHSKLKVIFKRARLRYKRHFLSISLESKNPIRCKTAIKKVKYHMGERRGQKSAEKVFRIIWMAPKQQTVTKENPYKNGGCCWTHAEQQCRACGRYRSWHCDTFQPISYSYNGIQSGSNPIQEILVLKREILMFLFLSTNWLFVFKLCKNYKSTRNEIIFLTILG